jgi:DNA-binding NarL/FixJ family response regulator
VPPIRVHLGPMPEMLRTFIEDLLAPEPDIVIVGHSDDRTGLVLSARRHDADMLITQTDRHPHEDSLDVILAAAPIKIFTIGPNGKDASVVDVSRHAVSLVDDTQAVLGQAIRRAMRSFNPPREQGERCLEQ